MPPRPSWFQRFLLPGLAFKAVVIGGGYATGRELAEYFIPSGPWGGVAGMLLAMLIWSCVCVVTFLFARLTRALDYRSFFKQLLGRFVFLFEFAYFAYVIVVLAVFGAAAGSLGLARVRVATALRHPVPHCRNRAVYDFRQRLCRAALQMGIPVSLRGLHRLLCTRAHAVRCPHSHQLCESPVIDGWALEAPSMRATTSWEPW